MSLSLSEMTKIQRGPTPANVKQLCLELCRKYLGGVWLKATTDDLKLRRLTGGYCNQLYYCAIPLDSKLLTCCPPTASNNSEQGLVREVAVMMFQDKHFMDLDGKGNDRQKDMLVAVTMSERGLGPKVYGVWEGGQIMKFYNHITFGNVGRFDTKWMTELAKRLAQLHSAQVAIEKSGNSYIGMCEVLIERSQQKFDLNSMYEKYGLSTLRAHPVAQEWQWLKQALIGAQSPVTLIHGLLKCPNIMCTQTDGLLFCDFEYMCYDYRGFDFGRLFHDLGRGSGSGTYVTHLDQNILDPFVNSYISESTKHLGPNFLKDTRNSSDHIVGEIKIFVMIGLVISVLVNLDISEPVMPDQPLDKPKQMSVAEFWYRHYMDLKSQLIKDNLVN